MANNNGDGSSGSNSDVSMDDQHQFSNARSYQIEALDQAIKQNTIVFLETGSGKTLMAAQDHGSKLSDANVYRHWQRIKYFYRAVTVLRTWSSSRWTSMDFP
nr:endoribonuclease Dicer homolog 2 [Tanacetum cinerariifolium]